MTCPTPASCMSGPAVAAVEEDEAGQGALRDELFAQLAEVPVVVVPEAVLAGPGQRQQQLPVGGVGAAVTHVVEEQRSGCGVDPVHHFLDDIMDLNGGARISDDRAVLGRNAELRREDLSKVFEVVVDGMQPGQVVVVPDADEYRSAVLPAVVRHGRVAVAVRHEVAEPTEICLFPPGQVPQPVVRPCLQAVARLPITGGVFRNAPQVAKLRGSRFRDVPVVEQAAVPTHRRAGDQPPAGASAARSCAVSSMQRVRAGEKP
ncbi:hypothetical protein [Streptomyces vinaceus]|uniref:hypothetical protein n=1 Tax=Streptomyces vinaceus TaxID=1960 RepID=UPI003678DD30